MNKLNPMIVSGVLFCGMACGAASVATAHDPVDIRLLGSAETTRYAAGVEIVGSMAYVADFGALEIFDVRDPRNPIKVGMLPLEGSAHEVRIVWGQGGGDESVCC